ncbi:unnamed protein product [Diatraea saccharalis]|uniref:Uncharacterized protein n=1 Tax=Diatraea saccharalis TaxID=40085 RepID=A0A9N9WDN9_9NEOP|nr:unnamed protein product [Diatraea saccharalis]
MASRYLIFNIFLLYLMHSVSGLQNGKVKITVGTTAGCGDTVAFIRDQLKPTFELYEEFLEIEYVPWGRTQRDENGVFTFCQFNPSNCWANRMHRCSLNLIGNNQTRQLEFMSCEFSSPFPGFLQESYACARSVGLNVVAVDYCLNNPHLDTLDDEAQAAAVLPVEKINFIPYIIINDDISVDVHEQSRQRLSSVVCFLLAEDPTTGITACQI